MGDPFITIVALLIGLAVGGASSVPYAFFCRAVVLGFLLIPYNMVIGGVAGGAFAFAASRQRQDVNPVVLIGGGLVVGFLMLPAGGAIVNAIGACHGIFLSPILVPMFGAIGAVVYLACQRGIRGRRDRAREQRYGRAISEHTMLDSHESDPANRQH